MRKRSALILWLTSILIIVGIASRLFARAYQHEQVNHALIAAIQDDNTEKALAALQAGADANTRCYPEGSPGLRNLIRSLFDRILHHDADTQPEHHSPALISLLSTHRAYINKMDCVIRHCEQPILLKALLEHGADPNARDHVGRTPLILATELNYKESIHLLISYGADVNAQDEQGETVLFKARSYRSDILHELLLAGANINAVNHDGMSSLMKAVDEYETAMLKLLLDCHANVNITDNNGKSALDYAREKVELFEGRKQEMEFVRILIKAGAKTGKELDAENKQGK